MIVSDTSKHPTTLVEAILAYVGATSLNLKYLMTENDQLANSLQDARKEVEQLKEKNAISVMEEMRKAILDEVSTLKTTMWKLYDGFVTMHKVFVMCMAYYSREKIFFKLWGTYMLPSPM